MNNYLVLYMHIIRDKRSILDRDGPELCEKSAVKSERLKFLGIDPKNPKVEASASRSVSPMGWLLLDSLLKDGIGVSLPVECPSKALFRSPPYMNEGGFVKAVSDLIIPPPPPFIPCIIGGMFVVVCDESIFGEVSTLLAWVDMFTEGDTFVLSVEEPLRYALDRLDGMG